MRCAVEGSAIATVLSLLRRILRWSRLRQAEGVSQIRRTQVFAWVLPSIALALIAGHTLACVLAYMHTAPIDAAYRATDESGRGILRAPPADVMAADWIQGITWIASFPVAIVATLLAAWALERVRVEGAALVFAYLMTIIGIFGCVAGLVVAAFGVLEVL